MSMSIGALLLKYIVELMLAGWAFSKVRFMIQTYRDINALETTDGDQDSDSSDMR